MYTETLVLGIDINETKNYDLRYELPITPMDLTYINSSEYFLTKNEFGNCLDFYDTAFDALDDFDERI